MRTKDTWTVYSSLSKHEVQAKQDAKRAVPAKQVLRVGKYRFPRRYLNQIMEAVSTLYFCSLSSLYTSRFSSLTMRITSHLSQSLSRLPLTFSLQPLQPCRVVYVTFLFQLCLLSNITTSVTNKCFYFKRI